MVIKADVVYSNPGHGVGVRFHRLPDDAREIMGGNCPRHEPFRFEEELEDPSSMPAEFRGKLEGLYGWGADEEVYAALPRDKRAALLLMATQADREGSLESCWPDR